MDLIELRNRASYGRLRGDFSCAYELSEVLYKLKRIVIKKFLSLEANRFEYFEGLGFEIKISEIEYEGSVEYVPLTFNRRNWNRPSVQMKIPVSVANTILVLGLP